MEGLLAQQPPWWDAEWFWTVAGILFFAFVLFIGLGVTRLVGGSHSFAWGISVVILLSTIWTLDLWWPLGTLVGVGWLVLGLLGHLARVGGGRGGDAPS